MVTVTRGVEAEVGWELHGAIWKAVRHSMLAWTMVVVMVRLDLVANKLVEALYAETLHLVAGALGGCLGPGHSRDDLGEETAHGRLTFCVRGVWIDRDGLERMEEELQSVSLRLWKQMC